MSTTEIAIRPEALASERELPSLAIVAERILEMAQPDLDEIRRSAEAYALYEQRTGNDERAIHCVKLARLAEAALGVLAFDDPSVLEMGLPADKRGLVARRTNWSLLAAALERGQLLEMMEGMSLDELSLGHLAARVRWRGWASVPTEAFYGMDLGPGKRPAKIGWRKAREFARERGIDFSSLPCNRAAVAAERKRRKTSGDRWYRDQRAKKRLARAKLAREMQAVAADRGPVTDEAYSYLRRCLQKLHDSQREAPDQRSRYAIGQAITSLYEAEHWIAAALGMRDVEPPK